MAAPAEIDQYGVPTVPPCKLEVRLLVCVRGKSVLVSIFSVREATFALGLFCIRTISAQLFVPSEHPAPGSAGTFCTLHNLDCTLHTEHCTLHTAHCTLLHTAHNSHVAARCPVPADDQILPAVGLTEFAPGQCCTDYQALEGKVRPAAQDRQCITDLTNHWQT